MDDREEMEHVPWQELLAETEVESDRRRVVYLGAALLGALLLGVMLARSWIAPSPDGLSSPPVAEAEAESADETPGEMVIQSVGPLPVYSEADLMAVPAGAAERAAVTRAEWFVTDYFTADHEPSAAAEVRASLPSGASPVLPQDGLDGVSYVEWARAFRVDALGDDVFRVAVAFRSLAAPPDRGFSRQPVRAVEVLVAVRPDGGTTVLDVPAPLVIPAGPEAPAVSEASADPPAAIIDAAMTAAAGWGAEARLVSAHQAAVGWRVLVSIADGVGNRWPLAIHVDVP